MGSYRSVVSSFGSDCVFESSTLASPLHRVFYPLVLTEQDWTGASG